METATEDPSEKFDDRLRTIADDLRQGKPSPAVTVRGFLDWYGASRRGYWIVKGIRESLHNVGLVTNPDFELAYIDAPMALQLAAAPAAGPSSGEAVPVPAAGSVPATPIADPAAETVRAGYGDPTYRIGKLAAANSAPVFVKPDAKISEAVTLMLHRDFSQLPVMQNERSVKGVFSWRSLGSGTALGRRGTSVRDFLDAASVRDFLDAAVEVDADMSLFTAIPAIVRTGYVLVRGDSNIITGIVTTSDLSLQFQQLAEPFLLLSEIENQIRRLIDGKYTQDELQGVRDPADRSRTIGKVSDLTFGEYIRLLQQQPLWDKLGSKIDRGYFVAELDKVRLTRNSVMHFDPDGVEAKDIDGLRQFAKLLTVLHDVAGATGAGT